MTDRVLRSYKQAQIKLGIKLLIILLIMVIIYAALYYLLGLSDMFGKQGIYLDGVVGKPCEALYFSVVTITTLGYGDFTPLGFSRLLAATEALAGLLFAGYSISQVLSIKQDASIEYILKAQIIQTYTGMLENIRDAKEAVTDYHRVNRRSKIIDTTALGLYHSHPLYSSVIALQKLNGYTAHISSIDMLGEIEDYLNRAATMVEELSSMIRKFVNYMEAKDPSWKTNQSKKTITEIVRCLEVQRKYTKYTKYRNMKYKGHANYDSVLNKIITDLRRVIS